VSILDGGLEDVAQDLQIQVHASDGQARGLAPGHGVADDGGGDFAQAKMTEMRGDRFAVLALKANCG
jgi:hypothetical protein